jgi:hypothetical protein
MNRREKCQHCGAEYWWNPSGPIKREDHARPDGRECRKGNPHAPTKSAYQPKPAGPICAATGRPHPGMPDTATCPDCYKRF